MNEQEIAELCATAAYEAKGENIVIIDVDKILVITSYFVVVTGRTSKHLQGLADSVTKELRSQGINRLSAEGYGDGNWVLLDFGDVIVQLFEPEARERYGLEGIWDDAPRVDWAPNIPVSPSGEEE